MTTDTSPYASIVEAPNPSLPPEWGTTTTVLPPRPRKQHATMDVYIIWAIVPDQPDAPWVVAAWDSEAIAENEDGWLEELAKAEEDCGGRFVRVTRTSVNYDAVAAAFQPVEV